MLPTTLCFVDIETTGTSITSGRIIEIGIVRVTNGKIEKTFQTLINPEGYLDPFVQTLTGITQDDIDSAPSFRHVKDEILEMLQDSVFVAHNVRFDYGFLRNEFKRHETSFSSKHFCTVKLARLLFPELPRYNLDTLIEQFKLQCEKRHRAFDDAKAIFDFYQKAEKMVGQDVFHNALTTVLKRPTLPSTLETTAIDSLPETPGVYIFYGENELPLYIGKSVNIRDRVLSHFVNDHTGATDLQISQQITHIETIETAGELGALFLESTLIKTKQPLLNRMLRNQRKLLVLEKTMTKAGYATVTLRELETLTSKSAQEMIGIFKSKKQAHNFLFSLVDTYGLCPRILGIEKAATPCFSYHLGKCRGACIELETPLRYNFRFDEAFYKYKIHNWPFDGPIIISEKYNKEEHFMIDKWCFLGSVSSDEDAQEKIDTEYAFDYDTYKILLRYLKHDSKLRKVRSYKTIEKKRPAVTSELLVFDQQ